jgi:FkbM family methyltransferase
MRVKDLPGTSSLVARYPSFSELALSRAARLSADLLLHPARMRLVRDQKQLSATLVRQIDCTDLTGDKRIVQIGANDGKHDDPIRHILAAKNIGAVLVEPLPVAFNALSKLHANRPNTQLVQGAISREGGDMSLFVPVVEGQELQSSVWACRTKEQAAGEVKRNMGRRALKSSEIVTAPVHSQTAAELLEYCALSPGDVAVLVCDTEGQDTEIVHSFLDSGARPEVMLYEQLHVTEASALELKAHLTTVGYTIEETIKDVLAVLPR